MEVKWTLAGSIFFQKIGDRRVNNRAFAIVEQLDFLGDDIERVDLVMLRKQ